MKLYIKPEYLINPLFIVSLGILLLNDFYLKNEYHNWMTGKLSDVFGIITFALFCISFINVHKKKIFIATAILFGLWKTTYSQLFIDFWNTLHLFQIERTVDYTDIFCVLILVPVYMYYPLRYRIEYKTRSSKTLTYFIFSITIFALMSTSQMRYSIPNSTKIDKYLTVKMPSDSFFSKLKADNIYFERNGSLILKKDTLDKYFLKNVILNYDTIQRITIGLKSKRKKTIIYIDSVIIKTNDPTYQHITLDKKWFKNYKVDLIELLKQRDN